MSEKAYSVDTRKFSYFLAKQRELAEGPSPPDPRELFDAHIYHRAITGDTRKVWNGTGESWFEYGLKRMPADNKERWQAVAARTNHALQRLKAEKDAPDEAIRSAMGLMAALYQSEPPYEIWDLALDAFDEATEPYADDVREKIGTGTRRWAKPPG